MPPTWPSILRILFGIATVIAGLVVLVNLPATGDTTLQVAAGIGLVTAGCGVVVP